MKGKSLTRILLETLGGTAHWHGDNPPLEARPTVPPDEIAELGFPACTRLHDNGRRRLSPDSILGSLGTEYERRQVGVRTGSCMVTVCTANYLYFARTLVDSVREHHPQMPCFVLIADWDGRGTPDAAGATCLAGREVGGPLFDFMALKYSAVDLCCALKPYVIRHLMESTSFEHVVYLDSDIVVYAPLDGFLSRLQHHDFVTTPHTVAPLAHPDRFWERPTLGDLAYAGPLNAGMFGVRVNGDSDQFIGVWQQMVTAPGAFLLSLGGQMEQNAFNWIHCFADSVAVHRDQAYNVAYWNFHERRLRWTGLDRSDGRSGYTVNGEPLVSFHFSGFSPERPFQLSKWDARHSLYIMPSLAHLLEDYQRRLLDNGAEECLKMAYGFATFPSGIPIDERMRKLIKEHEVFLSTELSPWTEAGEKFFCEALLSPIPYTASLVPILFLEIYRERPDLQAGHPNPHVDPRGFLQWIYHNGIYEYEYLTLFDRHRPVLPRPDRLGSLNTMLTRRDNDILDGCQQPMGSDRHTVIQRLQERKRPQLAALVRSGEIENYCLADMYMIREAVERREDLLEIYPDPLFADAEAITQWIATRGVGEAGLPSDAAEIFANACRGRSLARIFTYLDRNWHLAREFPLALVGHDRGRFAQVLLGVLRHKMEFDVDDVLMYLWAMDVNPWVGLPLVLELGYNACGTPSSLLPEGQNELLGPLLEADPRGHDALDSYRRRYASDRNAELAATALRHTPAPPRQTDISVFTMLDLKRQAQGVVEPRASALEPAVPLRDGVNLFGYHLSPIGLGSLTRGLRAAVDHARIPCSNVVIGNVAMEKAFDIDDLVRRFDYSFNTNIVASYPHLHHDFLKSQPLAMTAGRRNIVYLAWELREGTHYWRHIYDGYDEVWALSDFAAESLAHCLERPVSTVPCVVQAADFPKAVSKQSLGLNPDRFTFLYAFDANSSIERKNPEGFVRAFSDAFRPDDGVALVLRVSNASCLSHRERLRKLLAQCRPGLEVQLDIGRRSHAEVLGLISACDCYVSLHRAEGFGYTCAEAMVYQKPVIASNYSGNLQFMNRDNSLLVDVDECEVSVSDGPFQPGSIWAEPRIDHAAAHMRQVFEEPELATSLGLRAAQSVRDNLSVAAVSRIVQALLEGES